MNGEMPWQIADLTRHDSIADDISNKAVLLITRDGRDCRFLSDKDLASRDKLLATHFVGMARPAILARLHSHNVDHCPSQAIGKKGLINDWMGNDRNTSIGGCPDDEMLLSGHHVRGPCSGCRSTLCSLPRL